MKNVYVFCEGYTEESFVNNILVDYFAANKIYLIPIVHCTKRTNINKFRGGITNYDKFAAELARICKQHPNERVTTMIDYYGLPTDFPGMDIVEQDPYKRVEKIELAVRQRFDVSNLLVYISLHEFESLLFSDTSSFNVFGETAARQIATIRNEFGNPELINNSFETAPSKRIYNCIPTYSKVSDGTKLAKQIGIEKMMNSCSHFKKWVDALMKF